MKKAPCEKGRRALQKLFKGLNSRCTLCGHKSMIVGVCLECKRFQEKTMKIQTQSLRNYRPLYASVACLCVAITAWGQATNSADVTGSVTDASGAVIPDVAVMVKD